MKYFIFDIDSTLADCSHRIHYLEQSPKNWDAFFSHEEMIKDTPIEPIVRIQRMLCFSSGTTILYVTGRPERTRRVTERWLIDNLWYRTEGSKLYMRPDDDRRDDDILKAEIMQEIGLENIICVFEDRTRVVKKLRSLGLRVLQVADGDY